MPEVGGGSARLRRVGDSLRGWLLVGCQAVLLVALLLVPTGEAWPVPGPMRMAGTIGRIGGFAAIAVGALQLGRSLRVHPAPAAGAVLRTAGLYRWVRHPIYGGVLLLAVAIAATSGSVVHLVLWAALVAVLTVKAHLEERLLRRRFPGYATYARTTGRFLPRPTRRPAR
jgi:protein-S-isoprenylcysteine O-methyltransferase Ste14